ncbi:MAG: hypothetical protein QGG40_06520, partial [Myxococcota bacterium]|jgi:hypothetical protein|nr:hypothetical protein [Myxococcota bacterium]
VGRATAEWTTQAYRDVHEWSTIEDQYAFFRVTLSMVAYSLLVTPYMFSALCYLGGPAAAISFTSLDATASYHFGQPGRGPYVEGGVGLVGDWLPEMMTMGGGSGPVVGAGIEWGHLEVGTRVLWSPAALHSVPGYPEAGVTATTLTLGIGS